MALCGELTRPASSPSYTTTPHRPRDPAGPEGEEAVDESAFWRGERKVEKSPTRDEEHDAYFAGLFL